MLKIDTEKNTMTFAGTITDACADVSAIINSLQENFEEADGKDGVAAETYRLMLTKGFLTGVCFNTTAKEMLRIVKDSFGYEAAEDIINYEIE